MLPDKNTINVAKALAKTRSKSKTRLSQEVIRQAEARRRSEIILEQRQLARELEGLA